MLFIFLMKSVDETLVYIDCVWTIQMKSILTFSCGAVCLFNIVK